MIPAERVLYYFEHVALLLDESCMRDTEPKTEGHKEWIEFHQRQLDKFMQTFYMFCHVGTAEMHSCQHADWEELFLKHEKEMIDSHHMKPYEQSKAEGPMKKEDWPFFHKKEEQLRKEMSGEA